MDAVRRFLNRLVSTFRSSRGDTELTREINAHLQLLEDRFRAKGLSAEDARYEAKRSFGGVDQAREQHRDQRLFRWIESWALDVRLGVRILLKYPGLSIVGGLGLSVAIAIAAIAFSIIHEFTNPALPLDEGDRIVSIQNWDAAASSPDRRVLHDFVTWRDELRSVQDVGAFRTVTSNLFIFDGQPELVTVAEITASGFRVARVQPLLGRHLLEEDEREGAPPVLVIGHNAWTARFASDPGVVGARVRLGDRSYTIVGVMPEGFAFPVSHSLWVPLRADAARYARRDGPALNVFGRLAPGATLESAQSEITTLGQTTSAAYPETHAHLRPQVLPYTYPFLDMDDPENLMTLGFVHFLVILLLALVAVNVAILVYARTATRQPEIAVRSALGAGRARIVGQLFLEALVLTMSAAAAGLALTATASRLLERALLEMSGTFPVSFGTSSAFPFWINFRLSPVTVAYVFALAGLAAAIVGVLPALKATGRRLQPTLRRSGSGGSGMQLGRTWTVLIVAQVAFAVAVLPAVVFNAWELARDGLADPGPAVEEFLTARLLANSAPSSQSDGAMTSSERAEYRRSSADLMQLVKTEAGIAGATFTLVVPGEEPTAWIEAEGIAMPPESQQEGSGLAVRDGTFGHEVRFNHVGADFFQTFQVPILAGRALDAGDATPASAAVVVNRSFAQEIFGDRPVLGRRVRYVGRSGDARPEDIELGRWYEIVGVARDFPETPAGNRVNGKLYHASAPGQFYPMSLALRVSGSDPASFAGRLREIAAAVDPNLQLRDVLSMADVLREQQGLKRLVAVTLGLLTISVVLLSSAGIYALMSFTVAQRRKEIGIRAALGADARRLVASIFSRAAAQLALGVMLGLLAAALTERIDRDLMRGHAGVVLPIVAIFMMIVGLLATLGPARRGLRIDPTEALREP